MSLRRAIRTFMAPADDPRRAFPDARRGHVELLAEVRQAREQLAASRSRLDPEGARDLEQKEQRLAALEARLAARIEGFRAQERLVSARYSAAEAEVRIGEALTGLTDDLDGLELAAAGLEQLEARAAAIDELLEAGEF